MIIYLHVVMKSPEILKDDPSISHVVAIHCETSSGILNPIEEISEAVYAAGCKLLVDSMSAFGAIDLKPSEIRYEAIVSSANKCIEGVPGFGFIIARKDELEAAKGNSHSLSLDVSRPVGAYDTKRVSGVLHLQRTLLLHSW